MSRQEEDEDTWAKATTATELLYNHRDTYFPPNPADKTTRLLFESDFALKLLDSIPPDQRKSPLQRATYEYLIGKILDVVPEYKKEAEDHLSKAVKLNPSLGDAWLCLGNCIWKKGDLISAKNCYNLALSKGPNKNILCQLSMLERKMAQGSPENQTEIVNESIQHAKEAITLDVKDGNSWYNLGNACLTSFFVTGSWDHSKLLQSLKAYQNAEKDERMKLNPDLYFNCATVNKYLENYERALSGFEAAALKDPSLNAIEVNNMVNLLDKLDNLLRSHTRAKRLVSWASSLAAVNLNSSYKRATIDLLSEGLNKAVAVVGKVLFFVKHENVTPLYYLVFDSNQVCFVLSLYGIHNDAIKEGDQLILLEPYYRFVDVEWKGKGYKFKSIRVDFSEQVLVNGKALPSHQAIRLSIYAQHKP
ncbi:LOW QUALITY PROTEIN: TPR_11 domain-containing protein, partial [Cephalotus follicularis]